MLRLSNAVRRSIEARQEQRRLRPYVIVGEAVRLGDEAAASGVKLFGFSAVEPDGAWTCAPEAELRFQVQRDRLPQALALVLDFRALQVGDHRALAGVSINGGQVFELAGELTDAGWMRVELPLDLDQTAAVASVVCAFYVRNPASPRSLGLGGDERLLGIKLAGFGVVEIAAIAVPAETPPQPVAALPATASPKPVARVVPPAATDAVPRERPLVRLARWLLATPPMYPARRVIRYARHVSATARTTQAQVESLQRDQLRMAVELRDRFARIERAQGAQVGELQLALLPLTQALQAVRAEAEDAQQTTLRTLARIERAQGAQVGELQLALLPLTQALQAVRAEAEDAQQTTLRTLAQIDARAQAHATAMHELVGDGGPLARVLTGQREAAEATGLRFEQLMRGAASLGERYEDLAQGIAARQDHIQAQIDALRAGVDALLGLPDHLTKAQAEWFAQALSQAPVPTVPAHDPATYNAVVQLGEQLVQMSQGEQIRHAEALQSVGRLEHHLGEQLMQMSQGEQLRHGEALASVGRLEHMLGERLVQMSQGEQIRHAEALQSVGRVEQLLVDRTDVLLRRQVLPTADGWLVRTAFGYLSCPRSEPWLATVLTEVGDVEPGTRRLIERLLKPGMVYVDVGANVGVHTVPAARRVAPDGRVFAIEPTPDVVRHLQATVALHGLGGLVTIVPAAASASAGEAILHLGIASGLNSLYSLGEDPSQQLVVPTVTLDAVLAGVARIDLMKIDVEGAELDVLAGARDVRLRNPDLAVIAEYGPSHLARVGIDPSAWFAAFAGADCECFAIDEGSGLCTRIAAPGDLAGVFSINLLFVRPGTRVHAAVAGNERA